MRITFINTLLLTFIIALASCSNKPAQSVSQGELKRSETCSDTVSRVLYPLGTALQDVQLFDSLSRVYLKDTVPIKAYTIRAVDLLAALGMPGELADSSICKYKYVRVYMGYHMNKGFKLFIVPVQDAKLVDKNGGIDLLLDSTGVAIPAGQKSMGPQYVLDLNAPCPNTCATSSPFSNQ